MPELQIYDKLLQFPLFNGLSHNDILQLVAYTRLDFSRLEAHNVVVKAGDVCDKIMMLVGGQIEATTNSADGGYKVVEIFNSPYMLQPELLFGLSRRYTTGFSATTRCNFISISKKEFGLVMQKFEVIRINYLNFIATMTQKTTRQQWLSTDDNDRARLVNFMTTHCLRPAGHKVFKILMTRLAREINVSRLDVSVELNKMQEEGLLTLTRGRITVPFIERFGTL